MKPLKTLPKGSIRSYALLLLSSERNVECWINNNVRAVRGRTFIGRKGVSDIAGFHRETGIAVYCEVKAIGDRLSKEQIEFLSAVKKAGGIALLAEQDNIGKVVLKEFNFSCPV